jgi:monoamine oxidase
MAEQLEADVAIVGAGLVAARRLVAAGKRPLVVEARERVGGRLLNEEIGDGKVVEVGGQWIGPTQERLAARRDQLTQRMPQGTVIKTMAIYERPFWREEGLSGQATSDAGPTVSSSTTRPEAILAGHARLFGPRAARPERFVERVWAEEEWTRGCYGCLMTTGGWTEYGRALRAPIGPIHWAGAETATVWNGYMDGAVQSGERAAAEALRLLGA